MSTSGDVEHFETRSKKARGMAQASLDLIEAMHTAGRIWRASEGLGRDYADEVKA